MHRSKNLLTLRKPPSPFRQIEDHAFSAKSCEERDGLRVIAKAMLAGTRNSTSVPAPTSLQTVSLPPISSARSRMPGNP